MTLRFTRSETDPNHYPKVVDDRPLIPTPYEDDLFLTGADPLICRSKRVGFRMWNDKLQACDYLEDLNFQKLYGSDVGPDLGNASEFHKLRQRSTCCSTARRTKQFAEAQYQQRVSTN